MLQILEITPTGLAYISVGGFAVVFSVFSLVIREKVYMNEVVLSTGFGILMGPLCAGIVDPRSWSAETTLITLEIMRFVLVIGLFAIGVELPKSYLYHHLKGMLAMVVPTMAIGWIIVAGLLKALFAQFDFVTCLVIAACLTPTDPTICAAILGDCQLSPAKVDEMFTRIYLKKGGKFAKKHVPPNIRHLITAESASNDCLAYPFISISLYLTTDSNRGRVIEDWILIGWLYQVVLGILIGTIIGYFFSHIMKYSHEKGYLDHESYVAQCFSLAIFTMGVVKTIGSDDLLAVFFAGNVIAWDGKFQAHLEGESFNAVVGYILSCGCFFYIGAWLPWDNFSMPEFGITPWRLVVLCIGILLLRRIPAVLVLYKWVPEITSWKEALFCGHFGPMGVGAMFISTLALHRLPEPQNPPQAQIDILATTLHPVVGFVVLVSIIVHGLSVPLFNFGKTIQTPRAQPTATLGNPTGAAIQSPDLSLAASRSPDGSSLPLWYHAPASDYAPQSPPPAVMKDEADMH